MEAPVFSDGIAKNVVLIDLEEQTVKVLPPSEKNGDFQCTLSTSVCYWKDSKIIAFGGMRRSGEGMSTVRMITLDAESKILKRLDCGWDLDGSAHWQEVETTNKLERTHHLAHIYNNRMYVFGGEKDQTRQSNVIWYLDLGIKHNSSLCLTKFSRYLNLDTMPNERRLS